MRYAVSFGLALLVPAIAWLSGFDFNERGGGAVFTAAGFLYVFGVVFTYPGWKR